LQATEVEFLPPEPEVTANAVGEEE
jgi:hypothetical protein